MSAAMAAADALTAFAARQPGRGEARPQSELSAAVSNLVGAGLRAAEAAIVARAPRPAPGAPYRRRWRVKP
jgi:hypothetical protein